jgi:hypothetical protein
LVKTGKNIMQRIYIFVIIAAIIFAVSYSEPLKKLFLPKSEKAEMSTAREEARKQDDSYEELGIELYRAATTLSDLRGKLQLLKMAKENREWFSYEDYVRLDGMIKSIEEDVKKTEEEYQKSRELYTKRTVQRMLEKLPGGE